MEELSDREVAPLVRLRRHFEFLRGEIVGFGFTRGCLIGNFGNEIADHSTTIRAGLHQNLGAWRAAIAGLLAEVVKTGDADAGLDPDVTALFILSAWQGAIVAAHSPSLFSRTTTQSSPPRTTRTSAATCAWSTRWRPGFEASTAAGVLPPDLGGAAGTGEVTAAVIARLAGG